MSIVSINTDRARTTSRSLRTISAELASFESTYLNVIASLAGDDALVANIRNTLRTTSELSGRGSQQISDFTARARAADNAMIASWGQSGPPTIPDEPEPDRHPYLGKLLADMEFDPRLADLIKEVLAKDHSPEWYQQQLDAAIEAGDTDKVKVLTAALWDQLSRMSYEEVLAFLNAKDPATGRSRLTRARLVVLVAAGGVPKIPALVNFALENGEPVGTYTTAEAVMLNQLGVKRYNPDGTPNPNAVSEMLANALLELSRSGRDAADLIVRQAGYFNKPDVTPAMAAALRQIVANNPDIVVRRSRQDPAWAQNIADLMGKGATDDELSAVLSALTAWAASEYANDPEGSDSVLTGLAQIDRAIRAKGHSVTVDYEKLMNLILKAVKKIPHAKGAVEAFELLLDMSDLLKEDPIPKDRATQADVIVRNNNLALFVLAISDPDAAKKIAAALKETRSTRTKPLPEGLDAQDWANVSGLDEMKKLLEISGPMSEAYKTLSK